MAIVGIIETALNKAAHGSATSRLGCVPSSPFATSYGGKKIFV